MLITKFIHKRDKAPAERYVYSKIYARRESKLQRSGMFIAKFIHKRHKAPAERYIWCQGINYVTPLGFYGIDIKFSINMASRWDFKIPKGSKATNSRIIIIDNEYLIREFVAIIFQPLFCSHIIQFLIIKSVIIRLIRIICGPFYSEDSNCRTTFWYRLLNENNCSAKIIIASGTKKNEIRFSWYKK